MNTFKWVATSLAVTLLASSFSFAQDRRGDSNEFRRAQRNGNNGNHGNNGRGPQDNRGQPDRHSDDRRPDMRESRDSRDSRDMRDAREQRGAGPDHQFQRGNRLPPQYRQNIYVVNDWRGHQLPPPPRNHYWVQTGADYVLVAIATGIIVQLVLSSSY